MISLYSRSLKNNAPVIEQRRLERLPLTAEVYISRKDEKLIRCNVGDQSEGGLFLNVDAQAHGLQKGRKVDIVLVTGSGSLKETKRLTGVIIRVSDTGIALVTYDKDELRRV